MTYEITFTLPDNEALEDLRAWQTAWHAHHAHSIRPGLQPLLAAQLPAARPEIKVGDRIVIRYDDGERATVDDGEVVVAVEDGRVYTSWFEAGVVRNDSYSLSNRWAFEVIR